MSEISRHHTDDKLIRMAGQIADFFRSQPDQPPEIAVAGHINDYWGYEMRGEFLSLIAAGKVLDPILAATAAYIRKPGAPPEGVAPNDPLTHMNEAAAESDG